ncbi:hypothetical protein [Haloarchaeobius sp. TZWSO28]|uniref:hypothetical protein n=1 Tax=Haloarchaeobius sp. TZWSO28 TaxID=3446119 RepID=UPI003EC13028
MTDAFADRTLAEHRRVFEKIWWQNPERQNATSSSWWFFILFPEGEEGYGPRQLMFSVAACVGDQSRVNDLPPNGMDADRPVADGVDRFNATTVGWAGDEDVVHDHVVRQPAEAVLSREDQRLDAWAEREDGTRRGSEITALSDRLGLRAHVVGEDAEAEFEAWGDLDSKMTAPHHSMDIDTPLGGAEVVAWRQMEFEGEFDLPDGPETLSGSCYFQRVCFDMPLMPWKWVWAIFPDGTSFSVLIPFIGPHVFRRGYKFFSSDRLERLTIPLRQNGFWNWGSKEGHVEFDRISVEPLLGSGEHPDFDVRVENEAGDYVRFVARTYGHARNWLDRPRLGGRLASHWSYNEFLFRMTGLAGRVGGTPIDSESLGTGFGTLEYSTGLGL